MLFRSAVIMDEPQPFDRILSVGHHRDGRIDCIRLACAQRQLDEIGGSVLGNDGGAVVARCNVDRNDCVSRARLGFEGGKADWQPAGTVVADDYGCDVMIDFNRRDCLDIIFLPPLGGEGLCHRVI